MSKQYPGGIISKTAPVPTQAAASGVWTLDQQAYWQGTGQWPAPQYQISRSLRFNSADTTFLSRTPASAGNRKLWTLSCWVKTDYVGTTGNRTTFATYADPNNTAEFAFTANTQTLSFYSTVGGTTTVNVVTNAVFRDPSAWYHLVLYVDVANTTVRIYVNGVLQTLSTNTVTNSDTAVNATIEHDIGRHPYGSYFNGYITEVNFIDGQALTPSSFGETNAQTGVWQPKAYVGTYGTNGFYVNFSDNSNTTAATLGKDYSGNGNNWTPNNFSVSAGAGNDSLVDSPTSYGTDTGVGGNVRGNYCTLNSLANSSVTTLANGNLSFNSSGSTASSYWTRATIAVSSGKWYWEVTPTDVGAGPNYHLGIQSSAVSTLVGGTTGEILNGYGYYATGDKLSGTTYSAYGSGFTNNDVIGVALDMDAGTLVFYKNNTSQGTAFTGITGTYSPLSMFYTGGAARTSAGDFNFGQRPFAYTAPSGFKALNTQNLPTPTIGATTATQANDYFDVSLYTGNASALTVTNAGMQPDFLWLKCRDTANRGHYLYDVVRGTNKMLFTNGTDAEFTSSSYLTSFNSSGFTLGSGDSGTNANGATYVAWQWKANGAGVTNTAGTITSTVSANTTSGFSVVTWTGVAGSAVSGTIGHGLGVAPSMIIVKSRNFVDSWYVYHTAIGNTQYLELNALSAATTYAPMWNSTNPTSTVFSTTYLNQGSRTQVAYCFAEVAGYSKFGSYTGNGSTDGTFVFCGFRPAFILIKNSSSTGYWVIFDVARNTYNAMTSQVWPNSTDAENNSYGVIDAVSNGFKLRNTSAGYNDGGITYIFAAFASAPQKFALAR